MTRLEYKAEFSRLRMSRYLKNNRMLPRDVFEFGWSIAQLKPHVWIVERILFWMYAYDRHHRWTTKDFTYEVNDEAYEKAKAKRKERKTKGKEIGLKIHNKVRPLPEPQTRWEDCSPPPEELLKKLKNKLDNDSQ